jgi:hypothetical protein
MNETLLDALVARLLEAYEYAANAYVAPIALLWPDEGRQWQPIVGQLRRRLPIVTLGDFDPNGCRGPGYWIRCLVAGTVNCELPQSRPIVYLPGVARSDLRAIEACPPELAPIAELQYRAQWFSHPNGKDWTVRSLLTHGEKGFGLQVADDADTALAMLLALDRLVDLPLDSLLKRRLDADFFRDLINPDPVRNLLGYLNDPTSFRDRLEDAQWSIFAQQCKANYGFDPNSDGELTAARKLGERQGSWANVWKRFAETPDRFPGIPDRLRQAKPMKLSFELSDAWPQDNEEAEEELRKQLLGLVSSTAEEARQQAAILEAEHAWRRATVWADLGWAPLAFALEQLAVLAELSAQPLSSGTLDVLATDYQQRGWRADDAVLRALAAAPSPADRGAASSAISVMYRPWLDAGARALQNLVGPMANAHTYEPGSPVSATDGMVTVFVDGLRLDVAHRLRERLAGVGLQADLETTFAPLPTVTETAKPALMPLREGSLVAGPEFHAAAAYSGTTATIQVTKALMTKSGVQVLDGVEVGDPSGSAWAEAGEVDHRGHDDGVQLVDYLDDEVNRVARRVREFLDAGWQQVEVVTDHGWILLPGKMDKVDLPAATAEKKKGRCARLKDGADVDVPTVPWFWDQNVRIALAPGIACFEANKEYEHGGVSPQECIVPRMIVRAPATAAATRGPEITKVKWLGLLCRIEFAGVGEGIVVDLRALPADPKTSIAEEAKETSSAGKVSLLVPDEQHQGEKAYLVLVDANDAILAQREVIVGSNR